MGKGIILAEQGGFAAAQGMIGLQIDFQNIFISDEITFTAYFEPDILNGITLINAQNDANKIKLIPYYAWDNREAGEMKVWIDYEEKKVVPTGLEPVTP